MPGEKALDWRVDRSGVLTYLGNRWLAACRDRMSSRLAFLPSMNCHLGLDVISADREMNIAAAPGASVLPLSESFSIPVTYPIIPLSADASVSLSFHL